MMFPPSASPGSAPWRRDVFGLMLLFGALNLLLLGHLPLANPDEARYAEIPREMLARGDWVLPHLNGIPYFEKPPLVYWLVGLARLAFGPGEFSARLTPALFGLGGILLTYAAARRLFGRMAGVLAAVALGTSPLYFGLSRILLLDMAVSVLIAATLFCFILAMEEPPGAKRRLLFYGVYASAALATLAKGLIGFLIPGAIMFLWLLVFDQWHRLRPLFLPTGALLFLALAAPWHVLAAQRHPGWAQFYFVHEHWARFTTATHQRAQPFWFFIPVVLLGVFPWMGFLGGAVREALGGGWAKRREYAQAGFFVTWAAFVLLFFSLSQSKLIPYVLPAFPPLAVLLGTWLAGSWRERTPHRLRFGLNVFAFACSLLGTAIVAAALRPGVIRDPAQLLAVRPFAFALAAVLFAGGVGAPWLARIRGVPAAFGTVAATMVVFFVGLLLVAPQVQRSGTKDLALFARERMQPGDAVFHYWAFFHDFVYYAGRPVGLVSYVDELQVQFLDPVERSARFIDDAELRRQWVGPRRVWLVVRKRDQAAAQSVFADASFTSHLIAESRTHSLLSNQP